MGVFLLFKLLPLEIHISHVLFLCELNTDVMMLCCRLPLSCATRILNTLDFPVLLVELLQNSPWSRTNSKGVLEKYIDQKWTAVDDSDRFKITKIEGQVSG